MKCFERGGGKEYRHLLVVTLWFIAVVSAMHLGLFLVFSHSATQRHQSPRQDSQQLQGSQARRNMDTFSFTLGTLGPVRRVAKVTESLTMLLNVVNNFLNAVNHFCLVTKRLRDPWLWKAKNFSQIAPIVSSMGCSQLLAILRKGDVNRYRSHQVPQ